MNFLVLFRFNSQNTLFSDYYAFILLFFKFFLNMALVLRRRICFLFSDNKNVSELCEKCLKLEIQKKEQKKKMWDPQTKPSTFDCYRESRTGLSKPFVIESEVLRGHGNRKNYNQAKTSTFFVCFWGFVGKGMLSYLKNKKNRVCSIKGKAFSKMYSQL